MLRDKRDKRESSMKQQMNKARSVKKLNCNNPQVMKELEI